MEKPIEDINVLESYTNRQVVLNYYQEEDLLWKRDGFEFTILTVKDETLVFQKKDKGPFTVSIKDFPQRTKNNDFQNYFILRDENQGSRLEIYFP